MKIPVKLKPPVTFDALVRMIADAILVNGALLIGIASRFIFSSLEKGRMPEEYYSALLDESINAFFLSAPWLTFICLTVYWLNGFYTYGRAYMGRYKVLVIAQAVSIAFLLFAAFSYLIPLFRAFPRSVFVSAWVAELVFAETARLWSLLWKRTTNLQVRPEPPHHPTIRKVLVIGGAGYIGSLLVRKLLERRYEVVVLDALIYGDQGIRELYANPQLRFIKGDMRDIEAIVGATQGVDAVVHLGALVGDPACAIDENLTLQINLAATRVVAEVAKGYGVRRFLFASTCSVYGASDEVSNEKSELSPVSLYAKSKIASEQAILELTGFQFSPTVLRFATIFGLSPRPRFDLVVNVFAARAVAEGSINVAGGDQWRPFLHVSDAAEALLRVLEADELLVRGEIFNIGSDRENYKIAQVGEMVASAVPGVKVVTDKENPDKRNYRVSFEKMRQRLGFVPGVSVQAGIAEIVEAVRSGAIGDYRSSKYNNHKTLSEEGMAEQIQRVEAWMSLYPVNDRKEYVLRNGHKDHKVLVVDDDEIVLALLQTLLSERGYQIITAVNGNQALAVYRRERPELVLLDLGLPDISGLEVLREIRTTDEAAKVIVVTGHGALESSETFKHGAYDFVQKPFDISQFLNKIDNAFSGNSHSGSGDPKYSDQKARESATV
jgi:nucleoside-diphosphate-sugar epimerase/ActR/RegA family two-component response regulator